VARKQPNSKYYTASEVKQILGIGDSALYNYVNRGELQRIVPPHRKQGVYLRSEVDEMAREMQAFFVAKTTVSSAFSKATKEDMPECVQLSAAIFGGLNIIPLEKRIAWLEKNPDIDYIVRHEGELMGYASIVPLSPEILEPLLKDEIYAKDLTPDEIEQFKPGKPIQLYIMAMGVKPRLSKLEKRTYASRLIKGIVKEIIEMGGRGIDIETIIARSETPDGIHILRHLGFTEVPSEVPGTRNFIIEVAKSGIPAILEYKDALAEWREKHAQAEQEAG
jgi:predicted DNA-binding transcriptional regulator AlpA